MLDKRTLFEIHRLHGDGCSQRQIARRLQLARKTVSKYLENPDQALRKPAPRPSMLDPYRDLIRKLLAEEPEVRATVILQRLQAAGFRGRISILREYLHRKRGPRKSPQAFIRFESPAGKQMQVDWGHFGSLTDGNTARKLYALAVVEAFSRRLYVHFTHSQNQAALHQGLLEAFLFFNGTPDELLVDNMLTAVREREGALIRFNETFLDFLRPFKIRPRACNPGAPQEKGKIERSLQYLRHNFWPLRSFADLGDVQRQVRQWLEQVANERIHQTTGEKPSERFRQITLRPLPPSLPDCRETRSVLVHKDFAVRFDANTYTTPPWCVGKRLILKADQSKVTIYHHDKVVADHPRCWQRKHRVEIPAHQEMLRKIQKKLWQHREVALFASLGQPAREYLQALAEACQPITKTTVRLLALKDQYGAPSLLFAIQRALQHRAYGADYIENILYQEMTPHNPHPPVKLKDEALNRIRLSEPSLCDYDAFVLQKRPTP